MAASLRFSPAGSALSSRRSSPRSARSVSRCKLTEPDSPAAIDIAPATSSAAAALRIVLREAPDAITPIIRLATETMPSSAPSTAARSHPARWPRCRSLAPMPTPEWIDRDRPLRTR